MNPSTSSARALIDRAGRSVRQRPLALAACAAIVGLSALTVPAALAADPSLTPLVAATSTSVKVAPTTTAAPTTTTTVAPPTTPPTTAAPVPETVPPTVPATLPPTTLAPPTTVAPPTTAKPAPAPTVPAAPTAEQQAVAELTNMTPEQKEAFARLFVPPGTAVKPSAPSSAAAPDPGAERGALWDRLAMCESTGNWSINTGNGYHGGLQFAPSTWTAMGGGEYAPRAYEATREQQIAIAERVVANNGGTFRAWPGCRAKLGLP